MQQVVVVRLAHRLPVGHRRQPLVEPVGEARGARLQRAVARRDERGALGRREAVRQRHEARRVEIVAAARGVDRERGVEPHRVGEIGAREWPAARHLLEPRGGGQRARALRCVVLLEQAEDAVGELRSRRPADRTPPGAARARRSPRPRAATGRAASRRDRPSPMSEAGMALTLSSNAETWRRAARIFSMRKSRMRSSTGARRRRWWRRDRSSRARRSRHGPGRAGRPESGREQEGRAERRRGRTARPQKRRATGCPRRGGSERAKAMPTAPQPGRRPVSDKLHV